jgi:hypothetical protein
VTEQFPPSPGDPHGQATDHVAVPPQYSPGNAPAQPETTAYDPWNHAASTVPVQPELYRGQVADLGEFGPGTPVDGQPPAPRKRRRRTAIAASVTAVVLLAGGVGAFAAVRMWTGSGNVEPESAMPATVGAFLRVDFNPGVRDKLAVDNLVKKFPTGGKSTSDLLTQLEQRVSTSAGLDYNTDVKPWFDGRVGFGEWTHNGHPTVLITLASKDDAAARTALAKVQAKQSTGQFGYVVDHGYALITGGGDGSQANATAAAAEADKTSLADLSAYKTAIGHLTGDNLAVVYADLHDIGSLVQSSLPQLTALGPQAARVPDVSALLNGGASKLTGTVAVGVSVTDDGVEIRAHTEGLPSSVSGPDARSALDSMPSSTIAGFASDGLDPNSAAAKSITTMLSGLLARAGQTGGAPPAEMLSAIADVATKVLTTKIISFGLTGFDNGRPSLQATLQARSADDATSIMGLINQFTGGAPAMAGLSVTQSGDTIHAAFGSAGSGRLGDSALYKTAMDGISKANTAAFIDIQGAIGLAGPSVSGGEPAGVRPIRAIGIGVTSSGTSSDALIRVVIAK